MRRDPPAPASKPSLALLALSTLALGGCTSSENATTETASQPTTTPVEYIDKPVAICRGWAAVNEYGPVTLRPVDPDSPERGYPGTLCSVDDAPNVYRASFAPTGRCGNNAQADVRVPSPNAKPTVIVHALNLGPGTCSLGGGVQRASVVVFIETEDPDDVRIEYPDPRRAARIDAERASAERFTITKAIDACASKEDRDQFDPPAECLDLAHLRATDTTMKTVRASALITPAANSYAVTVPFRISGRRMATQETYRTDGTAIEDGEFAYP